MSTRPPASINDLVEQLRAELAAKDKLIEHYRQAANDLDALIEEGRVIYHEREGNVWSLMLHLGWPQGPEETTHELVIIALRARQEQRERELDGKFKRRSDGQRRRFAERDAA